jgi:AcrR family transcriptional regulator
VSGLLHVPPDAPFRRPGTCQDACAQRPRRLRRGGASPEDTAQCRVTPLLCEILAPGRRWPTVRAVTEATARRGRGRPARYSRDELLDVVVGEFNARGYDATSMEDIARATGLTKSSVYHHVTGKEELLGLALSRALDALYAVLGEPASRSGPPVDRLEHVVRRSVDVLAAELPYVTLLLRVRGNTATERHALERRRDFDRRLAALVQDAIDAGQVRADLDPRLVTRLLFGTVNSVAEWYRPDAGHGPAEVADALVALTFGGLRATP